MIDQEINELIKEVDDNNDGRVDYNEFVKMIKDNH